MPSSTPQFGEIRFSQITHGQLAKKLDDQLRDAAARLAAYVTGGDVDQTKKAKSEVVLKIKFEHLQDGIFVVGGDVSSKAPSLPLPARDRLVLDESGTLVMNLAPEVTAKDDPRQLTLTSGGHGDGPRKEM